MFMRRGDRHRPATVSHQEGSNAALGHVLASRPEKLGFVLHQRIVGIGDELLRLSEPRRVRTLGNRVIRLGHQRIGRDERPFIYDVASDLTFVGDTLHECAADYRQALRDGSFDPDPDPAVVELMAAA